MARETSGYWIGPMPVDTFFSEFMPINDKSDKTAENSESDIPEKPKLTMKMKMKPKPHPTPAPTPKQDTDTPKTPEPPKAPEIPKDYFAKLKISNEKELYPELAKLFHGEGVYPALAPDYVMVDTSNHPDRNSKPGSKVKEDATIYMRSDGVLETHPTDMGVASMGVEFKPHRLLDVIDAIAESGDYSGQPLEGTTEARMLIRGQLSTYATEVCSRQHRTHFFMLFICHPFARFLRWDRSGIIVSDRFDYTKDCSHLIQFLWRYGQLTRVQQGFDPTVRLASKAEIAHAHQVLAKWKPVGVTRPVFKMDVPDNGRTRQFLVWGALAEAESPLGRATKGYPAVEVTGGIYRHTPNFLKEQWRSVNVVPEVETLKMMNEKGIINVPTLVCGGDLAKQTTRSHEFEHCDWRVRTTDPSKVKAIEIRVHTRFVVKEVGESLDNFKSSKAMMKAIYDAFQAHKDAYKQCGLIHRDISGGNILILEDGRGLLNDWDLARRECDLADGGRTQERTGTWPFMSIGLLEAPTKVHTVRDDMESFFWVVVYYSLLYLHHNITTLKVVLDEIFHHYDLSGPDGQALGGDTKGSALRGKYIGDLGEPPFQFDNCPPLDRFIAEVSEALNSWLFQTTLARKRRPVHETTKAQLYWSGDPLKKLHADMEHFWTDALNADDWPVGDAACNQLQAAKTAESKVSAKRSLPDHLESSDDDLDVLPSPKKLRQCRA